MSCKNSYDWAYRLAHTLRVCMKKYSNDDNLIVYPSAWYENYFELTFRDKDHHEMFHRINHEQLLQLVDKHIPCGWVLSSEETTLQETREHEEVKGTPLQLCFEYNPKQD